MSAVVCRNLRFGYTPGALVLDIDQLEVASGERVFLFGPSGSGKTTLLGILSGVLTNFTGEVRVLDREIAKMTGSQRDAFRGAHLGYIFQLFNLIPYLTVVENITLPCRLHAERRKNIGNLEDAARQAADKLGILHLLHRKVTDLSVGQQQRVAAARALLGAPELIIADEPTSSLDYDHRERFLELLFESCREAKATILFVSHDRSLMHLFDKQLDLGELNKAQTVATAE
ncbi:MAG: ABC transporter ATP-binding protein [Acidobacteria bacterium]|nr:ABC transporter ATP-binding protein [Acidobacteriota bacterium]